jgi:hypothetical protein
MLSLLHAIVFKGALEILRLTVTMEFATSSASRLTICMLIILPIFVFRLALVHPAISQTLYQETALDGVLKAISHRPLAEHALPTAMLDLLIILPEAVSAHVQLQQKGPMLIRPVINA